MLRPTLADRLMLPMCAAAIAANSAVCVMGFKFWQYGRGENWAWVSIAFAGLIMAFTWLMIFIAGEKPGEPKEPAPPAPEINPNADVIPLPGRENEPQGYTSYVHRARGEFDDCELDSYRLKEAVTELLRTHNGHASFNYLPGLTDPEISKFQRWLKGREGYVTIVRNSPILTDYGREALNELLPRLSSEAEVVVKYGARRTDRQ